MNPSDANSPLATLRQLKEMLDAGTLTPQEFETLKQQLVFGNAAPLGGAMPVSSTPAPFPAAEPLPFSPVEEPLTAPSPVAEVASAAAAPDWLAPPPLASPSPADYPSPAAERRNPLTLVFAIGGALLLLGLILYLALGRPTGPDEHLTSGSQTAADSAAIAPEVGPQTQQLTLPPTAPEIIRVAPSAAAAATKPPADSLATPAPLAPAKAAVPAKIAPAATPPAASDSVATKAGQ